MSGWADLRGEVPRTVTVAGVAVGRGTKVVLRPGPGGDVLDRAVAGRTAVVDGIHQDLDGGIQLSVLVDDDPGRDLGERRQPGHRFFFAPEEVEPLAGQAEPGSATSSWPTTPSASRWRAGSASASCRRV